MFHSTLDHAINDAHQQQQQVRRGFERKKKDSFDDDGLFKEKTRDSRLSLGKRAERHLDI